MSSFFQSPAFLAFFLLGVLIYVQQIYFAQRADRQNMQIITKLNQELLNQMKSVQDKVFHQPISETHKNIQAMSCRKLVSELQKGKIQLADVSLAFLYQCLRFGVAQNYVCDYDQNFLNLSNQSEEKRQNILLQPLGGLPFAFSNRIACSEFYNDFGFLSGISRGKSQINAYLMEILKLKGAQPLCASNIAQAGFGFDTFNYVWGLARNAWNDQRSASGSQGGAAGLVALQCVPLAIGYDLIGDLRFSAGANGVQAFKPSSNRVSSIGVKSSFDCSRKAQSFQLIQGSVGAISNNVDDLAFFCENVFGSFDHGEPGINNSKFNLQIFQTYSDLHGQRKLRIAIPKPDSIIEFPKALRELMLSVADTLIQLGHDVHVIDFRNEFFYANQLGLSLLMNYFDSKRLLTAEKTDEHLTPWIMSVQRIFQPFFLLATAVQLIHFCCLRKQPSTQRKVKTLFQKLSFDKFQLETSLYQEQKNDILRNWVSNQYDCLITPIDYLPVASQINRLGRSYSKVPNDFALLANILGSPSGVIPVKLMTQKESQYPYTTKLEMDGIYHYIKSNLALSEGLPMGIMVTTRPNEDQKCLGIMKMLQDNIEFNQQPPILLKNNSNNVQSEKSTQEK